MSRIPCARRRPSSYSRAYTRIAASAAAKSAVLPPKKNAVSRKRKEGGRRDQISVVSITSCEGAECSSDFCLLTPVSCLAYESPLLQIHRRRYGHRRRRPSSGTLRFPSGERLQHAVHALQRVESAHSRRSQACHSTGPRTGPALREPESSGDDGAASESLARADGQVDREPGPEDGG